MLGLAGAAQASVLTLQPGDGKDAQLADGVLADNNWGSYRDLVTNWSGNLRSIGLVEFDLGGLPSGAAISSATLSLFHSDNSNAGSQYDVFRVTLPWDENTVTFNTAPGIDPVAAASLVIGDGGTGVFRDWDVTSLVAGWAAGSYANDGMWIEEIPVAGNATAYFASSDNAAGWEPRLTIEYTVPAPGSLALLGLGMLGMGMVARCRA